MKSHFPDTKSDQIIDKIKTSVLELQSVPLVVKMHKQNSEKMYEVNSAKILEQNCERDDKSSVPKYQSVPVQTVYVMRVKEENTD